MITGKTKVYGILGNPVEHSFSPVMQNAAFQALGLDCVYVPFQGKNLSEAVNGVKALNICGLSVTIPFKMEILPFLDEIDSLARHIGAVNTLTHENGILKGYNTDGMGAMLALKEKISLHKKRILVLGYGGAARPIVFALAHENPELIQISGRKPQESKNLASELREKTGCKANALPWGSCVEYDILINTTPVGMWPHVEASPLDASRIIPGTCVFDIVYRPQKTRLLQEAEKKACLTVWGDRMLLYQGVEQFRLWTGREAPVEVMENALAKILE